MEYADSIMNQRHSTSQDSNASTVFDSDRDTVRRRSQRLQGVQPSMPVRQEEPYTGTSNATQVHQPPPTNQLVTPLVPLPPPPRVQIRVQEEQPLPVPTHNPAPPADIHQHQPAAIHQQPIQQQHHVAALQHPAAHPPPPPVWKFR